MKRADLINRLIRARGYSRHLHVTHDLAISYFDVAAWDKEAVAPDHPMTPVRWAPPFAVTCEAIRAQSDPYHSILLEGVEDADAMDAQIELALTVLSPDGALWIANCVPEEAPAPASGQPSTVWKSITRLRCGRLGVRVQTVAVDSGIALVEREAADTLLLADEPAIQRRIADGELEFSRAWFDEHRKGALNLVSEATFLDSRRLSYLARSRRQQVPAHKA